MVFLIISFALPDPKFYSFETSENQLKVIIYILSIMQTNCTHKSLDTHCLVSGKAFAEKEVLSLMESQENATFYGRVKFQNIFQVTVALNYNCLTGLSLGKFPFGPCKKAACNWEKTFK